MKSGERARQDLRRRLEEVLGEEDALTLMDHLPSDDFATKDDIHVLRDDITTVRQDLAAVRQDLTAVVERFDLKLEAMEHRVTSAFRSEFIVQTRTFVISMVAVVASMGSLVVAAARLT